MPIYEYGQAEIDYLMERDMNMAEAIRRIGKIEREVTPDLFVALVESVIAQQITTKAAHTVCARLWESLPGQTAGDIHRADVEIIQQCGLSMRKARYIKGIASSIVEGRLDIGALRHMEDEAVIRELTKLHGIGIWTAEMMLMFSLLRPDVVSFGDLGIRRGMMRLYGLDELTRSQFMIYRERYRPYGSVASLYLWAIAKE